MQETVVEIQSQFPCDLMSTRILMKPSMPTVIVNAAMTWGMEFALLTCKNPEGDDRLQASQTDNRQYILDCVNDSS